MSTPVTHGNQLTIIEAQPTRPIEFDAYGLVQAQMTFAIDATDANISNAINTFSAGADYPHSLGFSMKSYRGRITTIKGDIAMINVDYIGINNSAGYTLPQIHGVVNTSAQPIETHPNFTLVTDSSISSYALAGNASGPLNKAVFQESEPMPDGSTQFLFRGFGVGDASSVNPFAGVRQYLKPGTTVRGTIYVDNAHSGIAENLSASIGCYLNTVDSQTLIQPWFVYGVIYGSRWLVTNANLEPIGKPDTTDVPFIKVTYDLMYGGTAGWNPKIYAKGPTIF